MRVIAGELMRVAAIWGKMSRALYGLLAAVLVLKCATLSSHTTLKVRPCAMLRLFHFVIRSNYERERSHTYHLQHEANL